MITRPKRTGNYKTPIIKVLKFEKSKYCCNNPETRKKEKRISLALEKKTLKVAWEMTNSADTDQHAL